MLVRCFDIQYDTDGKRIKLPKEFLINVDDNMDETEMEEMLSDTISDKTGFCHKGFRTEIIA